MRNGSAAVLEPDQAHTSYNPENDFTAVFLDTPHGRKTGRLSSIDEARFMTEGRLSRMEDGTHVIIRGTIEVVRVFEDKARPYMPPAATIRLSSGTGADTIVSLGYREYERVWGYLVMGRVVSVSGRVVRSEAGAPEHIELIRLLIAGSDDVTKPQYLASITEASER